jgi:hypothetical protein
MVCGQRETLRIGPSAAGGRRHEEVIGYSVGDENHDRVELTVDGGRRARDAVVRAEE